jgi:hypothetical protein
MQIDAPLPEPTEDDEILFDLSRQAQGARDRARMWEQQADELLRRAQRDRNKAARWDAIADHIRTLQAQLKD